MAQLNLRKYFRFRPFRDAIQANFTELFAALGNGGSDGVAPAPYLGAVTNLGRAADNVSTDYSLSMAVTTRRLMSPLKRPRFYHRNYYSNTTNSDERLPGGPCQHWDWIEGPIGVRFHGGNSSISPNGGSSINDLGEMDEELPAGTLIRAWSLREGAQVWTGGRGSWHLGAGYLANPPIGERVPQLNHVFYPGAAWVNTYWPTIMDETTRRSVLFIDDSHGMGEGERGEPDLRGFYGMLERYFADRCAWTNMSTRGMSLQGFIGNHTDRVAMAQYFSDVYIGLGGNDANAGRTAAQMLADLDTVRGYYPGKGLLSGTELPKTNSTDSWATTASQTPVTQEAVSREFSRAKMYGQRFDRVYDWCKGASFFKTDGNIVHMPGITADGNHLNATGYAMAAAGERQTPMFY